MFEALCVFHFKAPSFLPFSLGLVFLNHISGLRCLVSCPCYRVSTMASKPSIVSLHGKDALKRSEWENLRPKIRRFYIEEDRTLEETRAAIYTLSGFQAR